MVIYIIAGIVFIFWGVTDFFHLPLPGFLNRRAGKGKDAERRRVWQRWLGVLELILGVLEILLCFFSDSSAFLSVGIAVLVLAGVCILGPYYSWCREQKENSSDDPDDTQEH